MSEDQGPDEVTHALVMPFVIVTSKGGPYDDQAFVAGWACGVFDVRLETIAAMGGLPMAQWVRTDTVPQLDLIAMRRGFLLQTLEANEDGWTLVRPVRSEETVDGS